MSSTPASSSPQLRVNEEGLDHIVQEALTTALFPIPRVAAAVASKNQVLWSGAGGKKTYYEDLDKTPDGEVTLETPFAMFSNTKFVTCLCALQMLEAGHIHLDDYAEQWIPELKGKKILTGYSDDNQELYEDTTSKVTVRDLFCHTGGLPYTPSHELFERFRRAHNLEKQVEGLNGDRNAITDIPHNFNPGSRIDYSTGIDHLGYIVEAISGLDLEEYTKRHIFEPLNISDGVYRRSPEYLKEQVNLVYPEKQPDGSTRFKPTAFTLPINPVTCGGGGGLHISAGSFIKLLQTLLNGGVYAPTGNRILQRETIDLFFTPQYTNDAGAKFGEQVKNWLHLNRDPFHRSKDNGGADASEVPHRKRGWGLGCGLNLEDIEGGRGAGTLWASGFGDTYCWIDRKNGICASLMVNTAPAQAPGVFDFWERWEREIYRSLRPE